MHYFQQWQQLPINVSQWQYTPQRHRHPVYVSAATIVNQSCTSVLDVGCGIGYDEALFPSLQYVGLDVTPKFIVETHRRGYDGVIGSCLDLPFHSASFDGVWANSLLVHLPPDQWKHCLDELVRVASRLVVTVEGVWKPWTEYVMAESYVVNQQLIRFYNNAYGEADVRSYMRDYPIQVVSDGRTQATIYIISKE